MAKKLADLLTIPGVLEALKAQGVTSMDDLEEVLAARGLEGERARLAEQLAEQGREVQTLQAQLAQAAQARAAAGQALEAAQAQAGGDPFADELFRPLKATFDRLDYAVQTMAKAMAAQVEQFQQFQRQAMDFADRVETRHLTGLYKDFDADKLRAFVKQRNLPAGISWEDAYTQYRGANADALIAQARTEAREAALKEAAAKGAPPTTELGEGPAAPVANGPAKDYDAGWAGLGAELESLGLG